MSLDEARHVLLSDTPDLISLIPRIYTTREISSSDPLPPADNLPSYTTTTIDDVPSDVANSHNYVPQRQSGDVPPDETSGLPGLHELVSRIMPWLYARNPSDGETEHTVEDIDRAIAESGASPEIIEERRVRMAELEERLHGGTEGNRAGDGATPAQMLENPPHVDSHDQNEAAMAAPEEEEYDDERNQRWLAGRGLMQLRDFVTANGVDEGNWAEELDAGPVTEYASRVLQLQRRATRNFILDYVLQQGISGQARELVDRYIENASRGMEG